MAQPDGGRSSAPPRRFLRIVWALHKVLYAVTGGRIGLRAGSEARLGTLRLRTIGRRSGEERSSMLFYLVDGSALVVVASNVGAASDPAWWLNLKVEPRASVDLPGRSIDVLAQEAGGDERERLWARFEPLADYAAYAKAAGRPIPIVILEPDGGSAGA